MCNISLNKTVPLWSLCGVLLLKGFELLGLIGTNPYVTEHKNRPTLVSVMSIPANNSSKPNVYLILGIHFHQPLNQCLTVVADTYVDKKNTILIVCHCGRRPI